jgi:competence ComEA-like helix-hairpin-helix protein
VELSPSRRARLTEVWVLWTLYTAIVAFASGVERVAAERREVRLERVRIELDRAPIGELCLLPGIGPSRAAAIVLRRVRHGPFADVEALAAVPGIGPETVDSLREFVSVGDRR